MDSIVAQVGDKGEAATASAAVIAFGKGANPHAHLKTKEGVDAENAKGPRQLTVTTVEERTAHFEALQNSEGQAAEPSEGGAGGRENSGADKETEKETVVPPVIPPFRNAQGEEIH